MDKKYHIDDRKKKISELLQNIEEKYKLSQEEKDFIRSFSKKIMFLKELYYLKFFFNNENKKYYVEQTWVDNHKKWDKPHWYQFVVEFPNHDISRIKHK